jgi:hypothetical protein
MVLLVPHLALAQGTTSGTAQQDVFIGQTYTAFIDDAAQNQKWFRYELRAGRSYCVEAGSHETGVNDANRLADPILTVYASNGTTVIITVDDTGQEPDSFRGARACFIANATSTFFVRLTDFSAGTYNYQVRLVETTMWASWFFIGGDYNSFALIRNTTTASISYTITWRSPSGTIVGTTSGTVGANAALGLNARSFIASPATNFNGTVELVHTASPEGLVGQVTSLSASTGLGYDSVFFQRRPW